MTEPSPELAVTVVCSHMLPTRSPEAAHAVFLCEGLARAGVAVTLVTSGLEQRVPRPPRRSYTVVAAVRSWGWTGLPRLWLEVRRSRPDVVLLLHVGWIYGFHPMVTFLPLVVRLTSRRTAAVTQFENLQTIDHPRWSKPLRRVLRWLPRSAQVDEHLGATILASDRVIFLSEQHRAETARRAPKALDTGHVIPAPPLVRIHPDPGAAREAGRSRLGLRSGEFALIYVGYVYRGKGLEIVLRALANVEPSTRLLILGGITDEDYGRELHELEAALDLQHRISWLGDFDPADIQCSESIYAADLCVLPFDEGVLLNNSSFAVAASHRLPILTTRGPGTEAAFRQHHVAFLVRPQDEEAMARAIDRVRSDEVLRNHLRMGAASYASNMSSWDVVLGATVATLRAAVTDKRATRRARRARRPSAGP